MSDSELLTLGTENTAKLWDLHKTVCTRSYEDTVHQKCFVGVDSYGDYIALGGEDSCVRLFHKNCSQNVALKYLCSSTTFVCGCSLMATEDNKLQLIAVGNQGHLIYLQFDLKDKIIY